MYPFSGYDSTVLTLYLLSSRQRQKRQVEGRDQKSGEALTNIFVGQRYRQFVDPSDFKKYQARSPQTTTSPMI
jgi:hypothetical protein